MRQIWMSVNRLVAGSKTATFGCPWKGSYCIVPLSISTRPSCKSTMPLQNMSQDNENSVIEPATGSHSNAPESFVVDKAGRQDNLIAMAGSSPILRQQGLFRC